MSVQADVFSTNLAPDPRLLREFRQQLTAWLNAASVDERTHDAILLASHEAAANAIEHGVAPVSVVGRLQPDAILIEIISAGGWTAHPEIKSDERGRGLSLMRGLLSDVQILAEEERTTVRLRMLRSHTPGPSS